MGPGFSPRSQSVSVFRPLSYDKLAPIAAVVLIVLEPCDPEYGVAKYRARVALKYDWGAGHASTRRPRLGPTIGLSTWRSFVEHRMLSFCITRSQVSL